MLHAQHLLTTCEGAIGAEPDHQFRARPARNQNWTPLVLRYTLPRA